MREKMIERKLRLGVEALGGLCLKLPATFFAGLPDRLCLLPGCLMFFAETKSSGLDLRPRQAWVKAKLEGLGFRVYVVNSEQALRALLNLYKPSGLSDSERVELRELERDRREIRAHDPGDDLTDEDLKRLAELYAKQRGYA